MALSGPNYHRISEVVLKFYENIFIRNSFRSIEDDFWLFLPRFILNTPERISKQLLN
jgi:hypothetical protein